MPEILSMTRMCSFCNGSQTVEGPVPQFSEDWRLWPEYPEVQACPSCDPNKEQVLERALAVSRDIADRHRAAWRQGHEALKRLLEAGHGFDGKYTPYQEHTNVFVHYVLARSFILASDEELVVEWRETYPARTEGKLQFRAVVEPELVVRKRRDNTPPAKDIQRLAQLVVRVDK